MSAQSQRTPARNQRLGREPGLDLSASSSIALVVGGYYLFDAGKITMGAIIAIVMLSSRSLAPVGAARLPADPRPAGPPDAGFAPAAVGGDRRAPAWAAPRSRPKCARRNIKLENSRIHLSRGGRAVARRHQPDDQAGRSDRDYRPGRLGQVDAGRVSSAGSIEPTGGAMLIDGIDSRQYRPQDLRGNFPLRRAGCRRCSAERSRIISCSGAGVVGDADLIAALRACRRRPVPFAGCRRFRPAGGRSGNAAFRRPALVPVAGARAGRLRPSCCILDEPTGAMDSQTEKLFVERLSQSLTPEQTLLISTHRPALFSRLQPPDRARQRADRGGWSSGRSGRRFGGQRDETIAMATSRPSSISAHLPRPPIRSRRPGCRGWKSEGIRRDAGNRPRWRPDRRRRCDFRQVGIAVRRKNEPAVRQSAEQVRADRGDDGRRQGADRRRRARPPQSAMPPFRYRGCRSNRHGQFLLANAERTLTPPR